MDNKEMDNQAMAITTPNTHEITVEVTLASNGTVASWDYRNEPDLPRRNGIETVVWVLEAKDSEGEEVPPDELCFAIPHNSGGRWGVELKAADKNVQGNGWLTDDEVMKLDGNLRGPQPRPEFPSDRWPLEFIWDVNPRRVMMGVRKDKDGGLFSCQQWIRVVDGRGNVTEDDPRVRFRSRW